MLVIRRAVDKNKSYTVIFLKGEEPKWIITSDYEHARILQIYKQDKKYEGIINDFTDFWLIIIWCGRTMVVQHLDKVKVVGSTPTRTTIFCYGVACTKDSDGYLQYLWCEFDSTNFGRLAQRLAQLIYTEKVHGSNPWFPTNSRSL